MRKVTKKQAIIARKKFKSKHTTKPRVQSVVDDLNNYPEFVEVLCDALLWYGDVALPHRGNNEAELQICHFLYRKFYDWR